MSVTSEHRNGAGPNRTSVLSRNNRESKGPTWITRSGIPTPLYLLPILLALGLHLQWGLSGSQAELGQWSLADPIAAICGVMLIIGLFMKGTGSRLSRLSVYALMVPTTLTLIILFAFGQSYLNSQFEIGTMTGEALQIAALDRLIHWGAALLWFATGLWITFALKRRGLSLFLQIFMICSVAFALAQFLLPKDLLRPILAPLSKDSGQLLASSLIVIFAICYMHSLYWRSNSNWNIAGSSIASFLLLGLLTLMNIPGLPLAICAMFLPMAFDQYGQLRKFYTLSVLILASVVNLSQDLGSMGELAPERPFGTFAEVSSSLNQPKPLPDPNKQPPETLVALEMWYQSPWFGHGLGSASHMDVSSIDGDGKGWAFKPNSLHILMVETGLLGISAFAITGFLLFLLIGQVSNKLTLAGNSVIPSADARFYRSIGMFLLATLALSLYHDILAQRLPWLFIGLLIGHILWNRAGLNRQEKCDRNPITTSQIQRELDRQKLNEKSRSSATSKEKPVIRTAEGSRPTEPDIPTIRPGRIFGRRR